MSSGFFPSYYKHKVASRGSVPVSSGGNGRRYFCVECACEYRSAYLLSRHFSVIHRNSSNQKVSLSIPSLAKHSLETPTAPCEPQSLNIKTCPLCSVSLGRSSYARHMINEHGTQPFLCTACGYRFSEYKELISHKLIHNDGKQPQLKVAVLSSIEEENNESNFSAEVQNPANTNLHECNFCVKKFVNRSHKFSHSIISHCSSFLERNKNGMYECNFCRQKFSYPSHIGAHLYKHRERLKCKSCGKQCFLLKELDMHIKQCKGDLTVNNSLLPNGCEENIDKEIRQSSSTTDKQGSSQEIDSNSSDSGLLLVVLPSDS